MKKILLYLLLFSCSSINYSTLNTLEPHLVKWAKKARYSKIVESVKQWGIENNKGFSGIPNNLVGAYLVASRIGSVETLKILQKSGVPEGALLDENGWNIGLHSATSGRLDIIKHVEKYIDPNTSAYDNYSSIMNAAYYNNLKVLKYLIYNKANLNQVTNEGYNVLSSAVLSGNYEIFKYLLSLKVDYKLLSKNKTDLLMLSAQGGNLEINKYLVNKLGFDVCNENKSSWNVLMFAVVSKNIEIVKYYTEVICDNIPLFLHKNNESQNALFIANQLLTKEKDNEALTLIRDFLLKKE